MKRQTLILVAIGVVLFVAGGAIAFASVVTGTKNNGSTASVASVTSPVVVATRQIPAGTTGQDMVSQGWVSIQQISQKKYLATDLTSLQGLTDEVVTKSVAKGAAIQSTQITVSATAISLPKGLDGVTITMPGAAGLAGYLEPGSDVDVYANITKLSQDTASAAAQANIPIPCTELAMTNIQVLDVSNVVPALGTTQSATGRAVPGSLTVLLAATPAQARVLAFMTQNETLSVVQTQKGTLPPPVGVCIGTGQTTTGS